VAGDGGRVRLGAEVSAALVTMNMRIDDMLRRVAPERAAEHQMRRMAMMGDVMARGGTLTVGVVCGKGLPKMDRWGKSDPYVVLEVGGGGAPAAAPPPPRAGPLRRARGALHTHSSHPPHVVVHLPCTGSQSRARGLHRRGCPSPTLRE
jgi:hypothetical protein